MSSESLVKQSTSLLLLMSSSMAVSLTFLDPINWPKQIMLAVAGTFVFVQAMALAGMNGDKIRSQISIAVLLGALLFFLPWIFSKVEFSRFLWGTFGRNNGFVTNLSLLLICLAGILFIRNGFSVFQFLKYCVFTTLFAGLYGLIQLLGLDWIEWSKQNEVFSLYGNSNFASAAFSIGSIAALFLSIDSFVSKTRKFAPLFFSFFVFLTLMTWQTNSIQGLMGISIAMVLLLISSAFGISRRIGWLSLGTAISLGVMILLGFYGLGPLGNWFFQYTLSLRLEYWLAGLRMGADHAFSGVGYDSYGDYFQQYRSDKVAELTGVGLTTNNAHNPFIQTFSTLGILGTLPVLLLFLWAMTLSLRKIIRIEKTKWNTTNEKFVSILFVSTWAMAFFSIDNISVATLNWFIMGLVIGFSKTESKLEKESETFRADKRHSTKGSQIGWIVYNKGIASLLALMVFAVSWISSSPSRNLASIFANNEISSSDLNALNLRQYRLLNVVENPFTRETEFKWAAEGFYNLGLEDATIKTLIIGLRKFPRDMVLLDNLAFVYEKKGDFNSAFLIRKKQIDIEKRNWRLYYFAFIDLKNLGRVDEAKGYLSKVSGLYRYMSQEERSQFEDFRREALKDL